MSTPYNLAEHQDACLFTLQSPPETDGPPHLPTREQQRTLQNSSPTQVLCQLLIVPFLGGLGHSGRGGSLTEDER